MSKDSKRLQQLEELENLIKRITEERGGKYTKGYKTDNFIIVSSKPKNNNWQNIDSLYFL